MPAGVTAAHLPRSRRPPTPERLLDAAERLFARRGYGATSIRDITREAGCNIAGVNYHFHGKARLYVEVFGRRLTALRKQQLASVRAALAGADASGAVGLDRLECLLNGFAEAFFARLVEPGDGRMLTDLIAIEIADPRLPPGVFAEEYVDPIERALAGAIRSIVTTLSPESARRAAHSYWAQLVYEALTRGRAGLLAGRRRVDPYTGRHIARFSAGGTGAVSEADP